MNVLKAPLALSLCFTLCTPLSYPQAPPHPQPRRNTQFAQLQGDQRILHALNRFTFGPRPGDLEAVRSIGLERWFDQQLHPATIDNADLNNRLAQFPATQWNIQDLLYRLPSNAEIRQAMNGRLPIPEIGPLHAIYENQIYRVQIRKEAKAQKSSTSLPVDTPSNRQLASDSAMAKADPSANAEQPAGMAKNAINADTSQNAMIADSQAGINAQHDSLQPAFDEASIRQHLALPPEQRVSQLASMEPAEFEGFIKSLRPIQRAALNAGLTPQLKFTVDALENPERLVAEQLVAARLTRDIYSSAQLQEVMTDFWLNHFNVYLRKNQQMPYYLIGYERDTVRPRALGKFEDLLEAVAHSPAMLAYLDNAQSIGPDSRAAQRAETVALRRPALKKNLHEGLNENYARELMELHTLGVNGGYTQADVTQVARILTGWTIDRPLVDAAFTFNPNRHEPGTKKVLGKKIKENGEMEGRELLHMLATSPATAHFISRELAVRFVSDDPPQSIVDRMAKSFLASKGDIPTVLKTLFHSPEFWSESTYRAKVKTPLEFVVSAARVSNADTENMLPIANQLRQMGMPVYGAVPPTGYDWKASTWVSTGALVDRMNFALALAAGRLPGIAIDWSQPSAAGAAAPTPESEEARLEPLLIPGGASSSTRAAALKEFAAQSAQDRPQSNALMQPVAARRFQRPPAPTPIEREDQLLAGLLIGSPDFQRR